MPSLEPQLVYFDYGSVALSPAGRSVLANLAAQYAAAGGGHLAVGGSSDRAEARSQPPGLSLRRAETVKHYLASMGVPAYAISVEGYGVTRLLVETAPGVREPQNRTVLVEFSPADACPPGALAPKTGARVFALPPPRPTDYTNLALGLFRSGTERLTYGDIDDRLGDALQRAGYPPRSYYATCGGFAMVTRVERVRSDGRPFAEPRRFVSMAGTYSTVEDFTIAGIIRALTSVAEGRFRVLVFLVTDQPVGWAGWQMTPDVGQALPDGGTANLPGPIAAAPAPDDLHVKALVYEFRKTGNRVEFVRSASHRIDEQLRKANIAIRRTP